MESCPAISDLDEDETEEDPLSLTNSPTAQSAPQPDPHLASDELFEFSSSSNDTMSHAEDIIFCGKLIPLKQNPHHQSPDQARDHCNADQIETKEVIVIREDGAKEKGGSGRRLPSSEVKYATQPNSPKSKFMRSSKSLDYQQLRRSLSSDCRSAGIRRYSSARSSGRYDHSGEKVYKPRWYSMLFGLVSKVPREMDMRDMKNRLVRRNPSTMFPQSDSGHILPATRNQHKSSWGLLSVLSCKDNASVGVTSSLGCMPRVNRCDNTYTRATCP